MDNIDNIIDEIHFSKRLEYLEDNWDDEGTKKIDIELLDTATDWLFDTAIKLKYKYHVLITSPTINAGPDGSIDIFFDNSKTASLLINFNKKEDKIVGSFYGYFRNYNKTTKGTIIPSEEQSMIDLLKWMCNLV